MNHAKAAASAHPKRKRGRDIHEPHRVATPLELLLDLFFVVPIAFAASQLHHGIVEHHAASAVLHFAIAFFGTWWAWMNYTWFASAYDNDDLWFRLLTMVQMTGVLIFSTGIPAMFQGDVFTTTMGYAVMRLAQVVQWLRAARGDEQARGACLRYAWGIAALQVLWVLRLVVLNGTAWQWPSFFMLGVVEMLVPAWAERAPGPAAPGAGAQRCGQGPGTPWHPHHIAERYGLLTLIVLGECVLGATHSVAGVLAAQGWSLDIALVGLGASMLVLSLWWIYFYMPSGEALHQHRQRAFGWGYGHYFVFASIAAMGAGLGVVADSLKAGVGAGVALAAHTANMPAEAPVALASHAVPALLAVLSVAVPEALFMVSVWAVYAYVARARARQLGVLVLFSLACIGAVVAAVAGGLPLAWALPALAIGPVLAVAHTERLRHAQADAFAVR
jgi:low temperature requirement protein LtrA